MRRFHDTLVFLLVTPLRKFVAQVGKGWNRVGGPDGGAFIGPQDRLGDQVVEQFHIFGSSVTQHVPGQVLEECHLVLARLTLSRG